jgi:AcrR family transcriptional regulator
MAYFRIALSNIMEKAKNLSVWTEVGYTLFAEEGLDGVQVERLARILQLNKSGFYHYFGDLDGYCEELLKSHKQKTDLYLEEVASLKSIDPDFLMLLVKYRVPIMFQQQLLRTENPTFHKVAEMVDQQEEVILRDRWADYLGIPRNPSLAIRYYSIVRDMFYTRVNLKNLEYPFLHKHMVEAKAVMQQMTAKELETDESAF